MAESPTLNHAGIQRRTLAFLFASQVIGSVGTAVGISVGALLAADLLSVGVSGLAQSAMVMGSALLAIPATRLARGHGRGPSLAATYLTGAVGGALAVVGATARSPALLFAGFFLFGGAGAATLQARFAAVDLAPPALYGRHLSLIVWGTTIGGVAGPNLAAVSGTTLAPYGIPTLAAPFALSAGLFALSAALLFLFLRPDPLLVAQRAGAPAGGTTTATRAGMREALRAVMASRDATLGVAATAFGHMVMVGVMAMAPVHIRGAGHAPAETLRIVGIVLSVHVAGMFAFAPLMGWLSDRLGRPRVILAGVALLLLACAAAGTAGHDTTRLGLGLLLLGLGWSATMVSGSALLSASIPAGLKPSAQGLSDLVMGLAGATAGALSGIVVQGFGYPALTLVAALVTLPLIVLVLRGRATAAA
jgi:MFS family permease